MNPELRAQLERLAELNDDELQELADALQAQADELIDGDATDDVLAALEEVAEALDTVRGEQESRTEAAADRQARRDELAQRIRGEADDGDAEDDAEPTGTDADPAEEDDEPAEAEEPTEEPEAVAAAATPRVGRVAARRPRSVAPRSPARQPATLTAAANMDGYVRGQEMSMRDFATAALSVWQSTRPQRGQLTKLPVARSGRADLSEFPEDRRLGRDPFVNRERIRAVTGDDAIVASGGLCAPVEVSYDLVNVSQADRPVRDALVRFGADRGGIKFMTPPLLTDVADAVGIWTEATDTTPGGSTKTGLTVTCPAEEEEVVDAIYRRLQFGNFTARYFPELVDDYVQLTLAQHAREAEQELLVKMATDLTAVDVGQLLGATRDVLAGLDRAIAQLKYRHRMSDMQPFRWIAPRWLRDMIRTDIARQLPVGSTEETLALADARIDAFFRSRGVNPSYIMDGEVAGQRFGTQGVGTLLGWPSTVITYLFPEGSFLFLDGGTLDLGVVRDTDLIDTNDFEMFAETFEGVAFVGVEGYKLTHDLCPDGAVSATVDIDPCTTGS